MSDSGLIMPSDLLDVMEKHNDIWSNFDLAIQDRNKFNSCSRQVAEIEFSTPITELFPDNILPAELSAALGQFESELQRISKIELDIRDSQEGIRLERERIRRNRIITIVIIVVVVAVIAYAALNGMGVL